MCGPGRLSGYLILGALLAGTTVFAQQPGSADVSEEFASGPSGSGATIQYQQPAGPDCRTQYPFAGDAGTQYDFKSNTPAGPLKGQVSATEKASGTPKPCVTSPTLQAGAATQKIRIAWKVSKVSPAGSWEYIILTFPIKTRAVGDPIEGDLVPNTVNPDPWYRHIKGTIAEVNSPRDFVFLVEQLTDQNGRVYGGPGGSQLPPALSGFLPQRVHFYAQ